MDELKYPSEKPNEVIFKTEDYYEKRKFAFGVSKLFVKGKPLADPVLENNSWDTIKAICQSGGAADYWSLGDEKNVSVTIGGTEYQIPHVLVDLSGGRYEYSSDSSKSSNAVFQSKYVLSDDMINPASNPSPNGDGSCNGWSYSELRGKLQPGGSIFAEYDSELTSIIPAVKTMSSYSCNTNELTYSDDVLFIASAREICSGNISVNPCEKTPELTTFGYYDGASDSVRVKTSYGDSDLTSYWWTRSPAIEWTSANVYVDFDGSLAADECTYSYGVVPCFAF